MMGEPVQRLLGVPATSDPMTLLGLAPGRYQPAQIDLALRARLAKLFMHPDGRTPEAEDVRRLLRDAADQLKQNPSAASPVSWSEPASTFPSMTLTGFDRQVLAVLIAYGGWNHQSRARLVSLAAEHGVGVQGLMRVMQGLAGYARSGGPRLGVGEISAGARLAPAARMTRSPQGIADGAPVLEKFADALADEIRRDDPSTIIKLSILFGLITIMVGIIGLRFLLASEPGPSDRPDAIEVATSTAPAATRSASAPDQKSRLAVFSRPPGFLGNGLPAEAMTALDQCPALPAFIDEAGRKIAVADEPSEAVFRNWDVSIQTIATGWVRAEATTRLEIDKAVFEALRNAAEQSTTVDRLLRSFLPPSAPNQPLDLWRGAWLTGMLAKFASTTTLPPEVIDRARAQLATAIDEPAAPAMSFEQAARRWLSLQLDRMVGSLETDDRAYDWWELWIAGHRALGRDEAFDTALCDALEVILQRGADLAREGPSLNVVARLLAIVLEHPTPATLQRLGEWFDSDAVASRDLWVLTSLVANNDQATWFPDRLVLPEEADAAHRSRVKDELARVWPIASAQQASTSGTPNAATGPAVDPAVGDRWLAAALVLNSEPIEKSDLQRMRQLVRSSRMIEAAQALAAQNPDLAGQILDTIDDGLVADVIAAIPSTSPGSPILLTPAQPHLGQRSPIGQAIGQDGVWALGYQDLGKKTKERLESLLALRQSAGSDLGPIDAELFIHEAYRGTPAEIKATAQAILVEQFASGPIIAGEMLDQFPDAAESPATSTLIERLTGALLPDNTAIDWAIHARLALVEHVLSLKPDGLAEIDELGARLIESLTHRQASLRGQEPSAALSESPAVAAELLLRSWRDAAELNPSDQPFPDDLPGLARRHAVRQRLAQGPIQRAVAAQLGVLDLLAYITIAERPESRDDVVQLFRSASIARAKLTEVLAQAIEIERTQIRVWAIRLGLVPPRQAAGASPATTRGGAL